MRGVLTASDSCSLEFPGDRPGLGWMAGSFEVCRTEGSQIEPAEAVVVSLKESRRTPVVEVESVRVDSGMESTGAGASSKVRQGPLSPDEGRALMVHEHFIGEHVNDFVRVGTALLSIRDNQLYRGTHDTFAAYLRERWDLSRPYAYQKIDAARVVAQMSANADTVLPRNEGQARMLVRLSVEDRPRVMRQAQVQAGSRPVTQRHIKEAAAELGVAPQVKAGGKKGGKKVKVGKPSGLLKDRKFWAWAQRLLELLKQNEHTAALEVVERLCTNGKLWCPSDQEIHAARKSGDKTAA